MSKTANTPISFPRTQLVLTAIVLLLVGFMIGRWPTPPDKSWTQNFPVKEIRPEISLVQFKKIEGDLLSVDVSGPARIRWGEANFVENDGKYDLPMGQIPHDDDLNYLKFAFVANTKTGKFYPADSYFARGVAVKHRRFFNTKEAAIEAGFIPTKGVK